MARQSMEVNSMTEAEAWERERLLEALDSYKRGLSEAPYLRKWSNESPLPIHPVNGRGQAVSTGARGSEKDVGMNFVVSTKQLS